MNDEPSKNQASGEHRGSYYQTRPLAEKVALALQYSRNYVAAAVPLAPTPKEHIEGLCDLVEELAAALASQPAEQPRGEPVALGYAPGELDRTAPEVIYLQVDTAGDNDERDEPWTGDMDENVSWCAESIGGLEIQYVRGDLIDQPKPEQAVGDGLEFFVKCDACGGRGQAEIPVGHSAGSFLDPPDTYYEIDACPKCDGAGFVPATPRPAVATPAEVTEENVERAAKGMWDLVPRGVEWPGLTKHIADDWRRLARAALAAQPSAVSPQIGDARAVTPTMNQPSAVGVPEGWKLVPLTPTVEMLYAARTAPVPAVLVDSLSARANLDNAAKWRAMLAAAPEVDRE